MGQQKKINRPLKKLYTLILQKKIIQVIQIELEYNTNELKIQSVSSSNPHFEMLVYKILIHYL